MKFSEIDESSWSELQPYLDTCLIPLTGLKGTEMPFEVTAALEKLRDFMDFVEIPFKGRIVTYPAIQYGRQEISSLISTVCRNVKSAGFKYAILVSTGSDISLGRIEEADLILNYQRFDGLEPKQISKQISSEIQQMWSENTLS
ncbi:DUF2487 domain-containing protein [Paenibacillus sediminis]|uniref:DUF2487 family protein n=1 Tax=Paenibacillus sediminis TaxID=664909 RepID=A0ABS4H0I3_9BACL|nr:DUF2487 family protein [Paenibacillus sediminis]MBP1935782.1 hypothetical protein [Paenibacillus sediminis]